MHERMLANLKCDIKQYLLFDPLNLGGLDFLGILFHPVKKKKFIFVCSFSSFNSFNLSVNC